MTTGSTWCGHNTAWLHTPKVHAAQLAPQHLPDHTPTLSSRPAPPTPSPPPPLSQTEAVAAAHLLIGPVRGNAKLLPHLAELVAGPSHQSHKAQNNGDVLKGLQPTCAVEAQQAGLKSAVEAQQAVHRLQLTLQHHSTAIHAARAARRSRRGLSSCQGTTARAPAPGPLQTPSAHLEGSPAACAALLGLCPAPPARSSPRSSS